MRIKFRRMLIPAFTLALSIVSGVWFYVSYTNLDLFTVKHLDSQAGPCSDVELKPLGDFQSKVVSFLAQDSDSSLVAAYHSNNDLLQSFQVEMGCYTADQIRNLALESKTCLKDLIQDRLFQLQMKSMENARRGLFIRSNESTYSSKNLLISALLKYDLENASPGVIDSTIIEKSDSSLNIAPIDKSPVSLKFQLSTLISKMNASYYGLMSDREQELTRLARARLEHGLRMGEARTRLFLLTLVSWMVSISLMSALYLKSVFRRSSPGPMITENKGPITGADKLSSDEIGIDGLAVSNDPAVRLDYDLTKVFFDSGGDIQVMKRRLNQHLVSSFAAIGNLKSYQRSGNAEGAINILKVLSESNQTLGFTDLKNRLDEVCNTIDGSRNDPAQWRGLDIAIAELSTQIEIIKERMDHHPAFKA